MTKTLIIRLALAPLVLALSACAGMTQHERNITTGAVVGGAAGAVLTGGSGVGTVGGAVIGGAIGSAVDPNKR
jgi:osmotically inducible lipoprotein OsmB